MGFIYTISKLVSPTVLQSLFVLNFIIYLQFPLYSSICWVQHTAQNRWLGADSRLEYKTSVPANWTHREGVVSFLLSMFWWLDSVRFPSSVFLPRELCTNKYKIIYTVLSERSLYTRVLRTLNQPNQLHVTYCAHSFVTMTNISHIFDQLFN